jgi:hypothetical protein
MSEGVSKTGFTPVYNNNAKQLKDGQLYAQANLLAQAVPKENSLQKKLTQSKSIKSIKVPGFHLEKGALSVGGGVILGGAGALTTLLGAALLTGEAVIINREQSWVYTGFIRAVTISGVTAVGNGAFMIKSGFDEFGKAYNDFKSK